MASIEALLGDAELTHAGAVGWGESVPFESPGVYLVSLVRDSEAEESNFLEAPLDSGMVDRLLSICPGLTMDGRRPSPEELSDRVAAFWVPNEPVLYVGKAGTSVRARVGQYYKTPIGARSPHAGGWFLKLLASLEDTYVHYAGSSRPEESERKLIGAFMAGVRPANRSKPPDPERPVPFANLQVPGGPRKPHGIRGATGCSGTRTGSTGSGIVRTMGNTDKTRVTLHEEILAILRGSGDGWMRTQEIAREVQRRGIYKKRDGSSDVTPYQIHGRTKNYPQLFERDGTRVRRRR